MEKLEIPIEYVTERNTYITGLLLMTDCQYDAGNVTRFPADKVAMIDHHQIEVKETQLCEIAPSLGSCSTLVWRLLKEENFPIQDYKNVATALYYGLFTDTNFMTEIHNPVDMDMRDELEFDHSLITLLKNSNLSLSELEIAAIALIRAIYNEDYRYATIKANTSDPNILGVISDFLLQVDKVDTCVVYNESEAGYKISVRSCIKEVKASGLADYLTQEIGSGGGDLEKAGGFINRKKYEELYPNLHSEAYFSEKMNEYFDNIDIIYAKDYAVDITTMKPYKKASILLGYVRAKDVLAVNTPITIRTLEGDVDMIVEDNLIIMIGIKGEVYPMKLDRFNKTYKIVGGNFELDAEYTPTLKNRIDNTSMELIDYAHFCQATGDRFVHAKELDKMVKLFTMWDKDRYMLGKPGDFMIVRDDDLHDIYVVERNIFFKTYNEMEL